MSTVGDDVTMTPDLIAWLRAQLDDDERVAKACRHKVWTRDGGSIVGEHPSDDIVDWVYDEGGWDHIALHDPARVLAEVDAKRRIVDSFAASTEPLTARTGEKAVVRMVLKLLALPYADRPGYRDEWRP